MPLRLDGPDHTKPSSCDGDYQNTWCPLPPILPPPSPYPPPPPPGSQGRSTVIIALIIASSALAFLALCLSVFILVRRRRLRRRREALLEAALAPAGPAAFPDDGGPGEEVVHHVWHIRTVGLDEASIESIALTQYRAGGALGASDCTVCLGEFRDGELLRLLPKCAHAFHVQCIDTWLRAHVNCPLCRADVMDPAAAAAGQPEQPPGAHAAEASAERSASNAGTMEQERPDQQANEQHELRVQIEQPDPSSSPERPHRHPGARRAQNFRRVASMDSPSPSTGSAEEEAPEDERADGEKQGTGGAACCECEVSPGLGQLHRAAMKRSLSASSRWTLLSRHCRTRSSLLPL